MSALAKLSKEKRPALAEYGNLCPLFALEVRVERCGFMKRRAPHVRFKTIGSPAKGDVKLVSLARQPGLFAHHFSQSASHNPLPALTGNGRGTVTKVNRSKIGSRALTGKINPPDAALPNCADTPPHRAASNRGRPETAMSGRAVFACPYNPPVRFGMQTPTTIGGYAGEGAI